MLHVSLSFGALSGHSIAVRGTLTAIQYSTSALKELNEPIIWIFSRELLLLVGNGLRGVAYASIDREKWMSEIGK